MMDKKTFCSFPFDSIFLGSDGKVKTCCTARDELGDLNTQTIEEIVNGKRAKEIRKGIVTGNWDMKNCSQCAQLEGVGAHTERMGMLYKYEEMKNLTEEDFILQQIDLRWSNTCNLACNYCYEYFSSIWAKILNKYMDPLKDSTDLLSYIEKNKDTISNVNLLGGEPLLQKENHKLFDILDNETRGYILTNLSVPLKTNKIAQKLIEDYPNVSWGISFENVGPRFEYVRHRAEWDILMENIDYLVSRVREVNIHPMYNIYTAFNLMEFYDAIADKGISDIFWCAILNPSHFSVFDLPKEMRSEAKQEINRVLEKYRDNYNSVHRLEEYRTDLSHDKPAIDHEFLKYTKQLETKWHPDKKYSFAELWPELTASLKKHKLK